MGSIYFIVALPRSALDRWNNRSLLTFSGSVLITWVYCSSRVLARDPLVYVSDQFPLNQPRATGISAICRIYFVALSTNLIDEFSSDLPKTDYLEWGPQDLYPAPFGLLEIIDPLSPISSFWLQLWNQGLHDWSSKFSFTPEGQLLFDGASMQIFRKEPRDRIGGGPVLIWGIGDPGSDLAVGVRGTW